MKRLTRGVLAFAISSAAVLAASAKAAEPVGDPILELPTFRCLGASWIIKGDQDAKAKVEVEYREQGQEKWLQGPPLWRVDTSNLKQSTGTAVKHEIAEFEWKNGFIHPAKVVEIPSDCHLFSGSIIALKPGTAYQIKLTLKSAGGGDVSKTLESKTLAEPVAPTGGRELHVVPGTGGGTGSKADPFKGLSSISGVKPGDTVLLHAGKYQGPWEITVSGTPDKPVMFRGAGDGEAIIDGMLPDAAQKVGDVKFSDEVMTNFTPEVRAKWLTSRVVSIIGQHDVWFENITIRNGLYALVGHESAHLVIRHCHIDNVWSGINANKHPNGGNDGLFLGGLIITDNDLQGCTSWPKKTKIPDDCGIWVNGVNNIVAYNYVHNFGDGIQTFRGRFVEDIDAYNNEVRQCTDDGIEYKDTVRNVRVFDNRITNVLHPISIAPVLGGPQYIVRNALYNMQEEPFKIHNSPSGVLFYNNTIVSATDTLGIWTPAPVYNCVMRNNLLVANKTSGTVIQCDAKTVNCDFDYFGFAVGDFTNILKWNGQRYKTLQDAQAAGLLKHSFICKPDGLFAAKIVIPTDFHETYEPVDLRLAPKSPAVGVGEQLPGFTDPAKPVDLGAYPLGSELPHYGPRSSKN
ncbi:MAG: right-handed parallel beta-helix repeat-containing protein [Phycisphaerales bacterium]|nr:right-handed parallel beta-helix repeat-containing protein [Phycisphaerales bacterium]